MHDPFDRDLERLFELDDAPGPARPVDDARLAAIVAGALGGAGFPPPAGPAGAGGGGATPPPASAVKGVAATKLALLAGGAITAAIAVVWLAWPAPASAPAETSRAVVTSPAVASAPIVAAAPDAPTPAGPPVPPAAPPAPIDGLAAEPAVPADVADPAPRERPAPARKRRAARDEPATVAAEPIAPEDLLAEANAARAAHRWRDADALYARVVRGTATGLAAQAALVASASIRLEHLGDPAGAARRFRAARAAGPRATLAEDARWGLAEAARALGDPAGERRALDAFLAHHAGSALAPRARSRRTELGAAP